MIIISNHVQKIGLPIPKDAVVRINLAWFKDVLEARNAIEINSGHNVYLDYPQGRTKPPRPIITLDEAIALAREASGVKYFAVSNVEDVDNILSIKKRLSDSIMIVPKIETKKGVGDLEKIMRALGSDYAMLDKEDLWTDVNRDSVIFDALIDLSRRKAKELNIQLLELQGVVFA